MSDSARNVMATLTDFLSSQREFLWEFIISEETGVRPQQGFRVAWAGGVLVAASVVLGTPDTEKSCPVPEPAPPASPTTVVERPVDNRI